MIPNRVWARRGAGAELATVEGMGHPTVPTRRAVPSRRRAAPYLEPVAGALWWTVGAAALPAGTGTVVLAAGLGLAAWLVVTLRRRPTVPLPPRARRRLLRAVAVTVVAVAAASATLGAGGWGELAVPLSCAIVGVALLPVSSLLEERALLAAGIALMVLGAAGALLALGTAGQLYPQGVVGLVAGGLLWAAGAQRTGLLAELRGRPRR